MDKKKMLFTGASGFLGRNTIPYLSKDYEIDTLGFSDSDDYFIDISKTIPLLNKKYDIVFHAAGKAHSVPKNKFEKQLFFDINLDGTKNICIALENSGIPKSFIYISSVAVYGVNSGDDITEESLLNGNTPYALSKIQAEQFLSEWSKSNNICLGILRPSLIAGVNPPGNLGAMIKGIKTGRYLSIGNAQTKKSILMAQDIARIVPQLTENGGIFNICDDYNPSFKELEAAISNQLGVKKPVLIPLWLAKVLAKTGDLLGDRFPLNSEKLDKILKPLTFSNKKAKRELNWKPLDVLTNFKV